jgi:hypothetical protein
MYCRKCYADLRGVTLRTCPKCLMPFDPGNPSTFLSKPFPTKKRIVLHLVLTTIVGVAAAFVVAFHQAARHSGH